MATKILTPASRDEGTSTARLTTEKFRIIWLANNMEKIEKDFQQSLTSLQRLGIPVKTYSDVDSCVNSFMDIAHEKIILLIAGALGQTTVPFVHDMSQLDSVFVFCHNTALHEKWAKDYPKIKGVFKTIPSMCQAVEQVVQQYQLSSSNPETAILRPPPVVRRSLTPEPPARKAPVTTTDDQHQEPSHTHAHRHTHSAALATSSEPHGERGQTKEKKPEVKKEPTDHSIGKPKEAFVRTTTAADNEQETGRLPNEKAQSPVLPFVDKHTHSGAREIDSRKSQQKLTSAFQQLQETLITATERKLGKQQLISNDDLFRTTSLHIDRLQDTFVQNIGKHVTSTKDDSNTLTKLFTELKQTLVDTLVQQQQEQPAVLRDLIKQTVFDALSEQQTFASNPLNPTGVPYHRGPITTPTYREVKITANTEVTRIDAAFRQQRDAVVANKSLRAAVQKWSSMSSMADLVAAIKTHGKNDLERAWLLFCWICQNIKYQANDEINDAEKVFRTRQAVCRGFAGLYNTCCSLLGIKCSEVSGYAKHAFLKPGENLKDSSHAWNSIVLDDCVYLLDTTWGAGGRDNGKELEDFYFLTSPEELIYTHYCTGSQLLEKEISKVDFLALPVMKAIYYRLGLTLQSPKQGLNETNQNLFKIAIRTPENVDLLMDLKVGDVEYPRSLHTFCQRDETKSDVYNCYIAPPVDGLYEVIVFAKTTNETSYQAAINMRLRVTNIAGAFAFPRLYSSFTEHKCILIAPLQLLVHENEQVLIHMIIPGCNVVKIRNGDDYMVPCQEEYKNGILKKEVRVQGDLQVCGRWDDNADLISILCIFNMI